MKTKVKDLERWREIKERKRKRRNVIVKRVEIGRGDKGGSKENMGRNAGAKIVEVKEIGRENEKKEGGK